MDAKKTPRADLENKRGLIFNISLLISLVLVLMAFQWKTTTIEKTDLSQRNTNTIDNSIDIPITEITPPPPPSVLQQPRIIEVPDEEKLEEEIKMEFDIEITQETRVAEFTISDAPKVEKEEVEDEVFLFVEQAAAPKDGLASFYKDISERIKYPHQAVRLGIEGKVFVEFVVNRDGSITDIVVVKGIGAGCDEEAVRVLSEAPDWNPARQRGRPVRQRMVLPITFKIQNNYL